MATEFQPYVGPRPFERTAADQQRFFGRDREARELLSRVIAHSAVLFYSQSGAGKTSLLNAKLIPMLERASFEVLQTARVRDVAHEDALLQQIRNIYVFNALRSWDEGQTAPALLASLSIPEFLAARQRPAAAEEDGTPRVVIFDQFEELFTAYQERLGDREEFFRQIGDALEADRLLRVVFAMREEYIAELDPYLPLLPEKLRTRFRLERLSEEDALLAVTEPLKGTEYSFAAGVAEQLVENLTLVPVETATGITRVRGESVEPVQLQVVCQTLWENCQRSWRGLRPADKKVITREYLETFGDVDEALSTFYESALRRVVQATGVKEGVLRRWFEQSLITSSGTRGTVYRGRDETGDIPNAAVDELVNQHVIRGEVRGGGSRWYELTHDRLIPPIKTSNERWLLAHAGGEQTPKRLEARAAQWVRAGRRKEDLLDEGELLEARRWLESPDAADVGYSEALFALVQASRAASEEAARERERIRARAAEAERLRWLVAGLALVFLLAVGAMVWALRKQSEAAAARKAAEKSSQDATDRAQQLEQANQRDLEAHIEAQAAIRRADEQTQLAKNREADAFKALADRKKVELALTNTRLAKTRSEKKAAADLAEYRKNVAGALEQNIVLEQGAEALGLLNAMLKVYENLNDPDKQVETLTRMAILRRQLANEAEAKGNEAEAEANKSEAKALDKRIEDIQNRKTGKRAKQR